MHSPSTREIWRRSTRTTVRPDRLQYSHHAPSVGACKGEGEGVGEGEGEGEGW